MAKKKAAAKKAAPKKVVAKKKAPAKKVVAKKKAAPAKKAAAGRGPGRPKISTSMEVLRALEAAIASADKLKSRLEVVLKKAQG